MPGTLTAKLCIKGKDQLHAYCKDHSVKLDRLEVLQLACCTPVCFPP